MSHLIPPVGASLNRAQAAAILEHYQPLLLDRAREVADALMSQGLRVYFWTVLTAEELVQAWPAELPFTAVAFIHYAPSATIQFASVHLRLDKATGEVSAWAGHLQLGTQ